MTPVGEFSPVDSSVSPIDSGSSDVDLDDLLILGMPEPKIKNEKYEEKSKPYSGNNYNYKRPIINYYSEPKIGILNSPYLNKAGSLPDPVRPNNDPLYRSGRGMATIAYSGNNYNYKREL